MTYEPTDGDPELAEVIRARLVEVAAERERERQERTARWCEHCLRLLKEGEGERGR